jgi:hypothetical protein
VSSGRETAHVAPDLGQDEASAQFLDAGNGGQELDRSAKAIDPSIDLPIDFGDCCVEAINLLQVQAQQEAVMPGDAVAQRLGWPLIRRWANWASRSGSLSPWAFSPRARRRRTAFVGPVNGRSPAPTGTGETRRGSG